ncbi:MAG: preprotein translocase subunit SecA [Oscillospiraceae bacterium]
MGLLKKLFGSFSDKEIARIQPVVNSIEAKEEEYKALSDEELVGMTQKLKDRLAEGETLDDILPDAFATCREASARVLGMRHFPVQLAGGVVLHKGMIAEMKTGEGKTLVATLPVYLNALTGQGVHVVTVNDYLAKRDSEWMGKVYRFLGLSVGLVVHGLDPTQRQEAYNSDITYGTNNEFGFDYLRDNMVPYKKYMVQRGHAYAIVDEVDSILIDEARTPLIISGQGEKSTDLYKKADDFVKKLKVKRITETDSKVDYDEDEELVKEGVGYIVDEKQRNATLTAIGIKKAEQFFGIENLSDGENMEIAHHVNQAIKARGVMKRDVDYVVRDGEVIIVDEHTGRLMLGRRYNEGLHQAIEAKEGVEVARESKTLATITFQNYFRMYNKLAGMTGTAKTEEDEFNEIYGLQVIEVPTNEPLVRKDHSDAVYKTVNGKYRAVIEQVQECHEKGQPVLVGTISIERSEDLSKLLKAKKIAHEVLNAKFHEKEAQIVSQAGRRGAVTIATNMAGRGTDILLGGNAEFMAKEEMRKMGIEEEFIGEATGHAETDNEDILNARKVYSELYGKKKEEISAEAEEVRQAGGLFIIGTERHESRRIDNQLRGRSGRQGDPGESRFHLSLEDDLMRLFGGDRVMSMMDTLGVDEDTPIENRIITNSIESAQRKIEGRNFEMRKNVLRFDDVMNSQREIIYGQRLEVLSGEDVSGRVRNMMHESIENTVGSFCAGDDAEEWNLTALRDHYLGWLTKKDDFHYTDEELEDITRKKVIDALVERADARYDAKEEKYGSEIMRELERFALLNNVDTKWMSHIDAMEELRKGIYLRGYAQRDPVVEYRIEGFEMFDEMVEAIREDTTKMILTLEIVDKNAPPERKQVAKETGTNASGAAPQKKAPVKKAAKPGRNDLCPCGSGLKFKKCDCKEYHS